MPRAKTFTRESVLKKAIPLFLRKGYAGTSIQDLEQTIGINKSSLYSEFGNKEELFLACMDHFAEFKSATSTLSKEPYGWSNIEAFFAHIAEIERKSDSGGFLVYSMREHHSLSDAVKMQNEAHLEEIRLLFIRNLGAEKTIAKPESIANVLMRLFAGAALLQNVRGLEKTARPQTLDVLMTMLRRM